MGDNARLTGKELENIYASYANFGEKHLGVFIQEIWKEAYELGKEDGKREGKRQGENTYHPTADFAGSLRNT